ncbi:MAG: hypothetical protein D6770_02395 [Anaerolineae bacterium]|nr:MAG: hypothetical protein D6770_02395 [Anaerolineae bacterium]
MLMLAFLLSACGAPAAPTLSPVDAQGTAVAMAMTMAAQTQAAQPPTPTPVPPSPTAIPSPTATFTPLAVTTPIVTPTTFSLPPTNTPVSSSGSGDECNQPLTKWSAPSVKLAFTNTVKNSTVTLSLYVRTTMGECGYMSFRFTNGSSATVPQGAYTAWAWVDGKKKDFSASTVFTLTPGSWNLFIEEGRLILRAGCAPNC